ncbi:MAG: CDP-glycerol--glycerophosphate glycerophosphotransferase [Gammaproteobacteria bacterium]|nr:CDP-glycerol glycerophosphotransferase family protein [Gammaproteobacteria bacterium]PCH64564.1 MAG: CDP-glycerol--glycerophosphate glycerophosphotransferase [Gammaproteobacteria bacterium]
MIAQRHLFFITQNYSYSILRPLQDAIRARGGEVRWLLAGKELNYAYLRDDEQQLHSVEEAIRYMPDVCYAPGDVIPYMIPGIKVSVFHGFNVAGKKNKFKVRGFFDLYCTQGPDTTEPFQALADKHKNFRVVETGWPKLDPLFNNTDRDEPNKKPTILYSSTFSERLTSAPHLVSTIKQLSAKSNWQWLVTLHPKIKPEIVSVYKAMQCDTLRYIESDDLIPLLLQADVMLCDTSSIMYEFLLTQKPVVTFRNLVESPYFLNTDNADEIENLVAQAISRPEKLMQAIKHYSAAIHPLTDGKSSDRMLDAVEWFLSHGHKGLRKKYLDPIRRYKIRKKFC